jgi:hypothetical protein
MITNLRLLLSGVAATGPGVRPSVPVIIEAGELDPCSNAVVVNLNPHGDGFLSVRGGPGTKYRELTRLYNGDQVYYCTRRGDWVGIVWERPWHTGCNVMSPWPVTQPYTGPCRSGWVHKRWLRIWAG